MKNDFDPSSMGGRGFGQMHAGSGGSSSSGGGGVSSSSNNSGGGVGGRMPSQQQQFMDRSDHDLQIEFRIREDLLLEQQEKIATLAAQVEALEAEGAKLRWIIRMQRYLEQTLHSQYMAALRMNSNLASSSSPHQDDNSDLPFIKFQQNQSLNPSSSSSSSSSSSNNNNGSNPSNLSSSSLNSSSSSSNHPSSQNTQMPGGLSMMSSSSSSLVGGLSPTNGALSMSGTGGNMQVGSSGANSGSPSRSSSPAYRTSATPTLSQQHLGYNNSVNRQKRELDFISQQGLPSTSTLAAATRSLSPSHAQSMAGPHSGDFRYNPEKRFRGHEMEMPKPNEPWGTNIPLSTSPWPSVRSDSPWTSTSPWPSSESPWPSLGYPKSMTPPPTRSGAISAGGSGGSGGGYAPAGRSQMNLSDLLRLHPNFSFDFQDQGLSWPVTNKQHESLPFSRRPNSPDPSQPPGSFSSSSSSSSTTSPSPSPSSNSSSSSSSSSSSTSPTSTSQAVPNSNQSSSQNSSPSSSSNSSSSSSSSSTSPSPSSQVGSSTSSSSFGSGSPSVDGLFSMDSGFNQRFSPLSFGSSGLPVVTSSDSLKLLSPVPIKANSQQTSSFPHQSQPSQYHQSYPQSH